MTHGDVLDADGARRYAGGVKAPNLAVGVDVGRKDVLGSDLGSGSTHLGN